MEAVQAQVAPDQECEEVSRQSEWGVAVDVVVREEPLKVSSWGVTLSELLWQHCPREGRGKGGLAEGSCAWSRSCSAGGVFFYSPSPSPLVVWAALTSFSLSVYLKGTLSF